MVLSSHNRVRCFQCSCPKKIIARMFAAASCPPLIADCRVLRRVPCLWLTSAVEGAPDEVLCMITAKAGAVCRSYALRIVVSGAMIFQHRTWFGATTGQDYQSTKISFWNSGGSGRVLVAVIGRWREQRMRISEFTAYSLLFTVLGGGEKLRISVIP